MSPKNAARGGRPPGSAPRRRRPELAPLVQPPAKLAHLTDDSNALYEALLSDQDIWDEADFAQQAGVALNTVYEWMSLRNALDDHLKGVDGAKAVEETDRTPPPPLRRVGGSPVWYAGVLRDWMMQVGIMNRDGTTVPIGQRREGRPPGAKDKQPRKPKPTPMRNEALPTLARYNELGEKEPALSRVEREERIAAELGITPRAVRRRVEEGRAILKQAAEADTPAIAAAGG